MVGPPSKCPACGLLFESRLIDIGPSVAGITFENVGVSCPRCGGMARVADGTYSSVRETLELISGSKSSRDTLEALQRLAQRSRTEKLSAKEIFREISDISPGFAEKIEQGRSWPAVGLIVLLIWMIKSLSLDIRIDFNWLVDQAWHISHGEDPERHLDSDAPPAFPYDPPHEAPSFPIERATMASTSTENRQMRRAAAARRRKGKRGRQ